jgi:hypothetical protein
MLRQICEISLQTLKQFLHTYCIPVHSRFCQDLTQNLYTQILLLLKLLFLLSNEMTNIILLRAWDNLTPLVWEMFDTMWLLDNEPSFRKILVAVGNLFHKVFQFFLPIIGHQCPILIQYYVRYMAASWNVITSVMKWGFTSLGLMCTEINCLNRSTTANIHFLLYSTGETWKQMPPIKPFLSPHYSNSHY